METLHEYLDRIGVLASGDAALIAKAKKEYRNWYVKQKKKEYRKKSVRKEVLLSSAQLSDLQNGAKKHQMKLSTYIRESALAYNAQEFLLPDDTDYRKLEYALLKIGNNVNQIAHRCNVTKNVLYSDVHYLRLLLKEIETEVREFVFDPIKK